MKKQILSIFLTCVIVGGLTGCGNLKQDAPAFTANPAPVSEDAETQNEYSPPVSKAAETQTDFALDLLKEAYLKNPQQNVLLSPYSAMQALAMAANGAGGNTRTEMEQTLGGIPLDSLNASLRDLRDKLTSDRSCTFRSANAIWVNSPDGNNHLNPDFDKIVSKGYDAKLSFGQLDEAARREINQWCSENTDQMIPEIVTGEIPDTTALMLLNAACFEGKWKQAFRSVYNEGTFIRYDGKEQTVPMMAASEKYYLEGENMKGFVKYYTGEDFAFAAILPDEDMEHYLPTLKPEDLRTMLMHVKVASTPFDVELPKFSLECRTDMVPLLKNMGMTSAFDGDTADFSRTLEDPALLWIGEAYQSVYIEVDQEGTKAAAGTVVSEESCAPERIAFDRPFLYMIVETKNMTPLFTGVFNEVPGAS